MIIYTCPKCGKELTDKILTIMPPIYIKECLHCGWKHEERDKIVRVPYTATLNK